MCNIYDALHNFSEEEEVDKMMEQKMKEEEERKRTKEIEERMSLEETKEQVSDWKKKHKLLRSLTFLLKPWLPQPYRFDVWDKSFLATCFLILYFPTPM